MSVFTPIDKVMYARDIAEGLGYGSGQFYVSEAWEHEDGHGVGVAKIGDRSFSVRAVGTSNQELRRVCQFSSIFNQESGLRRYYISNLLLSSEGQIAYAKRDTGFVLERLRFMHESIREDGSYRLLESLYSSVGPNKSTRDINEAERAWHKRKMLKTVEDITTVLKDIAKSSNDSRFDLGL